MYLGQKYSGEQQCESTCHFNLNVLHQTTYCGIMCMIFKQNLEWKSAYKDRKECKHTTWPPAQAFHWSANDYLKIFNLIGVHKKLWKVILHAYKVTWKTDIQVGRKVILGITSVYSCAWLNIIQFLDIPYFQFCCYLISEYLSFTILFFIPFWLKWMLLLKLNFKLCKTKLSIVNICVHANTQKTIMM